MLVPVLFGVTLLIFALLQFFSPIERATLYVRNATQFSELPEIIERYGLNDPVWMQYGQWMNQVFHGNFGWSRVVSLPVLEAIWNFLPATVELAIFATPMIILGGIILGSKAAGRAATAAAASRYQCRGNETDETFL